MRVVLTSSWQKWFNMLDDQGPPGISPETPWGLSWDQLIKSLRPSQAQINRLIHLTDHIRKALSTIRPAPDRIVPGGAFGAGTLSASDLSLHLYAVFEPFDPAKYFDTHLKSINDALTDLKPRPSSIRQNGLAVTCVIDDIPVSVYAAADFPCGPAQLLEIAHAPPPSSTIEARTVHLETTCAILRSAALRIQPQLFKDMVRVVTKWLSGVEFLSSTDVPNHYLVQLLVLQAVRSTSTRKPSPELYSSVMRTFLSLASSSSTTKDPIIADSSMPATFLWWPFYYDRHLVDWCIAKMLMTPSPDKSASSPLVIVDIAAPFVNVADSLRDWSEFRRASRDALRLFEHRDTIQKLQDRLKTVTDGFEETMKTLKGKVDELELLEQSPRRWSGSVQFTEQHMNSDQWCTVMEVRLRTILWRVNARRARVENVGYSTMIDLTLQMLGPAPSHSIDVDVMFRSSTAYLLFDKNTDHAFLQKRSEVVRNRDYPLQITVIA